jgi:O-succinylbenzoate synthase
MIQVRMPIIHPYEIAISRTVHAEHLILKVYTGDGFVFSECAAGAIPGFSYETMGTAREVLKSLILPVVMGKTIPGPDGLDPLCKKVRGHPMAKAVVENALWILRAQQMGISLAEMLGNRRDRLPAGAGVGIQDTKEDLVGLISQYVSQAYPKIKMKIKPGKDIKFVEHVRMAFPDISLMVDGNNAYSLDDANIFKVLDAFGLLMIEQPLAYDDILDHSRLQAQLKTPIGLDESIVEPSSARQAIEIKACRCINIKQARVGGLDKAKEIHDICQKGGIGVWCGGLMETGIGRAVLLAIAGLPNFIYPMDIGASDKYFQRDIIEPEIVLNRDGTLSVPRGPGLGVEVNEKIMDHYTVAREVIRI